MKGGAFLGVFFLDFSYSFSKLN